MPNASNLQESSVTQQENIDPHLQGFIEAIFTQVFPETKLKQKKQRALTEVL
jgi:hypothetical protein